MKLSLDDMKRYAADFVANLPREAGTRAYVVGLRGELGAGKTTFVQAVAKALGVREHVTSPTFVLATRYETEHPVFRHLVHMDAYRLSNGEADTVGFNEFLSDPQALMLIEWPEHLPSAARFPEDAPVLSFETIDETTRKVTPAEEHA